MMTSAMVSPSVRFINATVTSIDPAARHVETTRGAFDADILVVALGADLHPEATPGLVEGTLEWARCTGCKSRKHRSGFRRRGA